MRQQTLVAPTHSTGDIQCQFRWLHVNTRSVIYLTILFRLFPCLLHRAARLPIRYQSQTRCPQPTHAYGSRSPLAPSSRLNGGPPTSNGCSTRSPWPRPAKWRPGATQLLGVVRSAGLAVLRREPMAVAPLLQVLNWQDSAFPLPLPQSSHFPPPGNSFEAQSMNLSRSRADALITLQGIATHSPPKTPRFILGAQKADARPSQPNGCSLAKSTRSTTVLP